MKHEINIIYEESKDKFKLDMSGEKSKKKGEKHPNEKELLKDIIYTLQKVQSQLIIKLGDLE